MFINYNSLIFFRPTLLTKTIKKYSSVTSSYTIDYLLCFETFELINEFKVHYYNTDDKMSLLNF